MDEIKEGAWYRFIGLDLLNRTTVVKEVKVVKVGPSNVTFRPRGKRAIDFLPTSKFRYLYHAI